MAAPSMAWQILRLLLLALTTAAACDSPNAWASDDGKWWVGGKGQVSCSCSDGDVRDLSLRLSGNILATEIVNNTVRYTEPSATETVQNEYECWWKEFPAQSVKVTVYAVLNVTDLACRFDVRQKLNCSFSRADGEEFHDRTRYELDVASGNTSQCTAGQGARMHCMLDTQSYAREIDSQNFTLTMISERGGGRQTQQIELSFASMYVPKWPASEASRTTVGNNQTCLVWNNAKDLLDRTLEWEVELRPRQPGIPPLNLTLPEGVENDQLILTFCFPHPPQGFQVFDVRLRCHIKGNNTIWSEYYPEFAITTNATVPARAPQFMPNGFSFDKDDSELTVMWFPLEEVEHNGPNLTYDVYVNGNQKASHTYGRSATFTNWDASQPANVTVRSRNSEGTSADSRWLWVPAMSDVEKRRATHLRYHTVDGSTTFAWDRPEDSDLLSGYTIYWCNASDTVGPFCMDGVSTNSISLDDGELQEYRFNSSMALQDIALEPNYSDNSSGGMSLRLVTVEKKEFEAFTLRKARILEGIGALLVLGLVIMSVKKLRKMRDIRIEMPYMGDTFTEKSSVEPKPESTVSPRLGVPRITNPYYDPQATSVCIELQTFSEELPEREPEEADESFTEVGAQTDPESSSYLRMDRGNPGRNDDQSPPLPQINLNSNGYVVASPPRINPNANGYVLPSPPRLIPNNEGYINPPPPRLNPNDGYINPPPPRLNPNNEGYINPPPPRLNPNNNPNSNGYVMAPPPRLMPNNDGYVNPPPPRLIPNSDGYINPPPPRA